MYETIDKALKIFKMHKDGKKEDFIAKYFDMTVQTVKDYIKSGENFFESIQICKSSGEKFIYEFVENASEFLAINKIVSKERYYHHHTILTIRDLEEILKKPVLYRGVGVKTIRNVMKVINRSYGKNMISKAYVKEYGKVISVSLEEEKEINWFEMIEKISLFKDRYPSYQFYYSNDCLILHDSVKDEQTVFSDGFELERHINKYLSRSGMC